MEGHQVPIALERVSQRSFPIFRTEEVSVSVRSPVASPVPGEGSEHTHAHMHIRVALHECRGMLTHDYEGRCHTAYEHIMHKFSMLRIRMRHHSDGRTVSSTELIAVSRWRNGCHKPLDSCTTQWHVCVYN